MIYDVIIIWAWASWLFAWIHLNKNFTKLILEKTHKIWTKLLMSWWERVNITNINIDYEDSYFSQNKKFLVSVFSKYNQWDFINFCQENWLELKEEDRWRLLLKSWNSEEILNLYLKKLNKNNCEINLDSEVIKIDKKDLFYEILTKNWKKYFSKNLIVSSWGRSFFQTWTTWDWYNLAKELWLKVTNTFAWLCWISSKNDLSKISWITTNLNIKLIDRSTNKIIYEETWPILFAHFWFSWPIIFNSSVAIWQYLANFNWNAEKYIIDNLYFELEFNLENLAKKLIKFFELSQDNKKIVLNIQSLRSFKESKTTTGWIELDELDKNMQSKKYKWLFFIWEVLDVTWKTGWYNLQWCWSSAFVACDFINNL